MTIWIHFRSKMGTKTCIGCFIEKPLDGFYKHPKMSCGRDSKCKDCVKQRAKERHHRLMENDPNFLENERKRHREKYHRLGYRESQKEWDKDKPWKSTQIYKNLSRKLKLDKGLEAHHWNYNDDYLEDVFIMEASPHKKLHNYLTLDIDKRLFFVTETGNYLTTKKEHQNFIDSVNLKYTV